MFSTFDGDTRMVPTEMVEAKYPLRVDRYELIPDSAGPGKYRGGFGVRRDIRVLGHKAGFVLTYEHCKYTPPWGLFGGEPPFVSVAVVYKNDGRIVCYRKVTGLQLEPDEVISYRSAGGGGYGSPLERAPEQVQEDVENALISIEQAKDQYGVVIEPDSYRIDFRATENLRKKKSIEPSRVTRDSEYWCPTCNRIVDVVVDVQAIDKHLLAKWKCFTCGSTLLTRRTTEIAYTLEGNS
jgi:N-methylhydantoinase B